MTWREDKTLIILSAFTLFFAGITLLIVWFRPADGVTYQTFVTQLAGFSGALMMHLRGDKAPPAGSTIVTTTATSTATEIPPDNPPIPPVVEPDPTMQDPK